MVLVFLSEQFGIIEHEIPSELLARACSYGLAEGGNAVISVLVSEDLKEEDRVFN